MRDDRGELAEGRQVLTLGEGDASSLERDGLVRAVGSVLRDDDADREEGQRQGTVHEVRQVEYVDRGHPVGEHDEAVEAEHHAQTQRSAVAADHPDRDDSGGDVLQIREDHDRRADRPDVRIVVRDGEPRHRSLGRGVEHRPARYESSEARDGARADEDALEASRPPLVPGGQEEQPGARVQACHEQAEAAGPDGEAGAHVPSDHRVGQAIDACSEPGDGGVAEVPAGCAPTEETSDRRERQAHRRRAEGDRRCEVELHGLVDCSQSLL